MADTKKRIAQALAVLLEEKPLKKITIQDIVDRSHMTRQSFYYHFQDIYEVLELICQYEILDRIGCREGESFSEWVLRLMDLVEENRRFYRRILLELDWGRLSQKLKAPVEQQVCRITDQLFTENEQQGLSGGKNLLTDFLTTSILNYIFQYISYRKVPEEQNRENLREMLKLCEMLTCKCAGSSEYYVKLA